MSPMLIYLDFRKSATETYEKHENLVTFPEVPKFGDLQVPLQIKRFQ
jgi:hypothetical protein